MKKIFNKINRLKLEAQEKLLSFILQDSLNPTYQKGFNKKYFTKGASLNIQVSAEQKIAEVKSRAIELVNLYNHSTLGLLGYIEERGYKVILNPYATKFLKIVSEKTGFISPAKGFKALFINVISGSHLSFNSQPMFILEQKDIIITEFLHDFYLWLAMDMGLPGFEPESRKLFIRYFVKEEDKLLKKIQVNQMLMLKQAISRDKEAIEFVIEFEKATSVAQKIHEQSDLPQKIFI